MPDSGSIRRYKVATNAFVGWVRQAHRDRSASGSGAPEKGARSVPTIAEVDRMVSDLVQSGDAPASGNFLDRLRNALKACSYAIDLRERVGQYYPANDASTASHEHFLDKLRRWRSSLKTWAGVELAAAVEPRSGRTAPESPELPASAVAQNTYDALEVEDDLDHELDLPFVWRAAADADAAGDDELKMASEEQELSLTLACILVDVDEILEKVHSSWVAVKENRESVITASTVTLVGMRLVSKLNAMWLLKYPSMDSMDNIFEHVIFKWFKSDDEFVKANEASTKIWESNMHIGRETNGIRGAYQRGGMLSAFKTIGMLVQSFCNAIPASSRNLMINKRGVFGQPFDENRNPLMPSVLDPRGSMVAFLLYELPRLRNFYIRRATLKSSVAGVSDAFSEYFPILQQYFEPFSDLFDKRKTSIRGMFAVLAWIVSVYALQGNRRISKCFSLAKFSIWNIQDMLLKVFDVAKGSQASLTDANVFIDLSLRFMSSTGSLELVMKNEDVFVKNPAFSGALQLNYVLQFLNRCYQVILCYGNRVRLGCQIYHALSSQNIIGKIPLLESIVNNKAGRKYLFRGEKPAMDALVTNFFHTGHFTVNAIKRIKDLTTEFETPREGDKKKPPPYADDPGSAVYDALCKDDFTGVCDVDVCSLGSILDKIRRVSHVEQFDPEQRVLGVNFISVHDAFSSLFNELVEALPQQSGIASEVDDGDVIENSAFNILLMLDAGLGHVKLRSGLAVDDSSLQLGGLKSRVMPIVSSLFTKYFPLEYTREVSGRIQFTPSTTGIRLIEEYFFLPDYPNAHEREFGPDGKREGSNTTEVFCQLMDWLEDSPGRIEDSDIFFLADALKRDSAIVYQCSYGDPLPTLIAHSIAGTQKDRRLFEFLIQMGANDVLTFKDLPPISRPIHLCAEHGNLEALKTILCYADFSDLDTLSPSNESPLYVAVKNGHKDIYTYLLEKYASPNVGKPVMNIVDASIKDPKERKSFKDLAAEGQPFRQIYADVPFNVMRPGPREAVAASLRNDLRSNAAASSRSSKKKAVAAYAANTSAEEMAEAVRKADEAMAALLLEEECKTAKKKAKGEPSGAKKTKGGKKKK